MTRFSSRRPTTSPEKQTRVVGQSSRRHYAHNSPLETPSRSLLPRRFGCSRTGRGPVLRRSPRPEPSNPSGWFSCPVSIPPAKRALPSWPRANEKNPNQTQPVPRTMKWRCSRTVNTPQNKFCWYMYPKLRLSKSFTGRLPIFTLPSSCIWALRRHVWDNTHYKR